MEAIMRALGDQHAELDELLSTLERPDWERPVPDCPGWTVGDVVLHLAQTDELVVSSIDHGFAAAADRLTGGGLDTPATVDEAVGRMVDHERGAPAPEIFARWRSAAAAVRDLLAGSDPHRPLPWVVTDLPARTMATTRLSESWIHTRDIARAVDRESTATDRLWHIARLAWRTIPYAFTRAGVAPPHGPVAVLLTAPDGGEWRFGAEHEASTTVSGPALDFCLVAARRLDPAMSRLRAEGTDSADVLTLVRTYA